MQSVSRWKRPVPCAGAAVGPGYADAERLDLAERTSADKRGLREADQSSLALDIGGGAGAVRKGSHEEGLRGAGLRAVVGAWLGESVKVGGEDGFAPGNGEGV